jgi:NO-binding membrane sensor protein with MHYT domain
MLQMLHATDCHSVSYMVLLAALCQLHFTSIGAFYQDKVQLFEGGV